MLEAMELDRMTRAAIQHGGMFTRSQALAVGVTPDDIGKALRRKEITSVRRSFYAHDSASQDVVAAVSAGGVVSGFSALKIHGVDVPFDRRLHIRIPRSTRSHRIRTSRLDRRYLVGFSHARLGEQPVEGPVDPPLAALAFVAGNCTAEDLGVVLDAVLRAGLLTLDDVDRLSPILPRRLISAARFASHDAESVTESMVHRRLRALRLMLRQQVWLGESLRVDFVIGDRLIIEVDSQEHHGSREQRRRDYARDRKLQRMGYIVFRIDYMDVFESWASIVREILDLVSRRLHLSRKR